VVPRILETPSGRIAATLGPTRYDKEAVMSRFSDPMMDPAVNPQMNPRVNPAADPFVNPQMNPEINPWVDPRVNPGLRFSKVKETDYFRRRPWR
jgi:hypothetical protein